MTHAANPWGDELVMPFRSCKCCRLFPSHHPCYPPRLEGMKNVALWNKLQAFSFDLPEADFSFSKRLARENNWAAAYTESVIQEYHRFLYLCVEAGH